MAIKGMITLWVVIIRVVLGEQAGHLLVLLRGAMRLLLVGLASQLRKKCFEPIVGHASVEVGHGGGLLARHQQRKVCQSSMQGEAVPMPKMQSRLRSSDRSMGGVSLFGDGSAPSV